MKKRFIVLVLLGAMMTAPANAQWNSWNTSSTISGVFGAINHGIVCSTVNDGASIKGTTYIKGNKGGKLGLEGVENITMAPNSTRTPWPGQKLRFVLIFPPLPDNATEFDLIEPSTDWKFKDIKCK
jgi:hypothetical protein